MRNIRPCGPVAGVGLGVLAVATVAILGADDAGELVLGLALCTVLVAITVTDLERRLIPNPVLLAGALAAIAILAVTQPSSVDERAIAAAVAGGALLALALARPRGIGMGDVKLVAMLGLYLGRAVAPAVLIGFATGALVGIVIIVRGGTAARRQAIPFGPFLACGGIIGLWFGDAIVDWYTDDLLAAG